MQFLFLSIRNFLLCYITKKIKEFQKIVARTILGFEVPTCGKWITDSITFGLFSLISCMIPHFAAQTVLLAFQHYIVMLGTTVMIATVLVPQMGGGPVYLHHFPRWVLEIPFQCNIDIMSSLTSCIGWQSSSYPIFAFHIRSEYSSANAFRHKTSHCDGSVICLHHISPVGH